MTSKKSDYLENVKFQTLISKMGEFCLEILVDILNFLSDFQQKFWYQVFPNSITEDSTVWSLWNFFLTGVRSSRMRTSVGFTENDQLVQPD